MAEGDFSLLMDGHDFRLPRAPAAHPPVQQAQNEPGKQHAADACHGPQRFLGKDQAADPQAQQQQDQRQHIGEPDGLIAVGGDLSVDRLLLAYSYGIFPWFSFRDSEKPYWYCPLRRFVIFPSEIHVSHSMRTLMRKGRFHCSMNEDFEGVIANCSRLRIEEEGAWLGPDIIEAYTELHKQGFATSVEVWDTEDVDAETGREKLVGGHVLAGAQRLEAGVDIPFTVHGKIWRSVD